LLAVLLITGYALATRVKWEAGTGVTNPTQLFFVPMLLLLPAPLVPACVAAGLVGGVFLRLHNLRAAHLRRVPLLLTSSWYAFAPALVFWLAGEPEAGTAALPWLAVALVSQFAADFSAISLHDALAYGVRPRARLSFLSWVYLVDACLAPIGFLVAAVAAREPLGVLLVLPLVGLLNVFARERRARIDHALELSQAYRGTAFLLGDVIEADDEYTGSHSRDVVDLVVGVCDELGLEPRQRRDAEFVALLHDVGKIRIPAGIINKPGPLDDDEWAVMKAHTLEGERMLSGVGGLLAEIGGLVRSCHERWDGGGYPDGLAGDNIPLIARIVMACDAFSAITTDRAYRKARSFDEALVEMRTHAGTQFDPRVVAALERVVAR
jgi:HD-GYP domain-containing protein (c-di-GMP phosphodiesterase class II)